MMTGKVLIIGAGLTGLSTAFHLEKMGGIDYSIYEKRDKVGGLCRSEYIECPGLGSKFTFDILGHLLHLKQQYAKHLVRELLQGNIKADIPRDARIYSKGIYTRYPFQANTYGLPKEVVKECVFGLIDAKYRSRHSAKVPHKESFYHWILRNFGEGIARHFMFPYNQKIWTVHPRELTCEWIKVNPKYVPSPTIHEVVRGALIDHRKRFGYNVRFDYPRRGGIQKLPDAFEKKIKNLKLNTSLSGLDIRKKVACFKGEKLKRDFRFLVSTVPLPELILNIIDNVPEKISKAALRLKHTSVLNLNLGIKRENVDHGHWVYFPERRYIFYRVGFPKKFSHNMCPAGTSSLYVEIACKPGQMTPKRERELIARAKKDLIKAGILRTEREILVEHREQIPYAYVIYDKERDRNFEMIKEYLERKGIYSVGRYGDWKYSTMEEAILEGKEVAEKLASQL
ncbi:MAG: FAD-dependent oxidoreductase [Elusimicrobiota bacterium]|nr:FAD-dependent oxidoreductase [Elusimicrobiota bacterium]MDH5661490.1 FAD-dependent oxidoreductase [Elusimicrobiota bacterium]